MEHVAGPDVSVNETSVCIVDDTGRIVREAKVASEPNALLTVLNNPTDRFKRIRTTVAVALQRSRRSKSAGDLC